MKVYKQDRYLISENETIEEALKKIELNGFGFVCTTNKENEVVGLATDGDIRRGLIKGIELSAPISLCANNDFVSADVTTPREQLLKRLDSRIQFIPLIDKFRKLHSVVSKKDLPLDSEKAVYIRSRAPVRVSFGGGGSDLTHYFEHNSGAVINTAISIYCHCVMRVRDDASIIINSLDLGATLIADNLEDAISQDGPFGLIQSLLHVVRPTHGFELSLNSDFPVGSGLGGSAAVAAAVLGCFNVLRSDQWNQHELAEIAFQAERLHLGVAGGWQDQYAAVFGGFNFMEFFPDENIVSPIRLHPKIALELEESLILCDTGISHDSGNIHVDQKESMAADAVKSLVAENVQLTYSTRKHLLRGDLAKFGNCLDAAWHLKRNFSSMISSSHLDAIYDGAIENGALGGKLLGAGGGGFFIFYVSPFKKHTLMSYLGSKNLNIQPFRFEPEGLITWTSRESD